MRLNVHNVSQVTPKFHSASFKHRLRHFDRKIEHSEEKKTEVGIGKKRTENPSFYSTSQTMCHFTCNSSVNINSFLSAILLFLSSSFVVAFLLFRNESKNSQDNHF